MMRFRTAVLSLMACYSVHAQVAPLKPGLWQVQIERETNGQKAPDMSERLKNMPPERRAQFEAMMKQRGVSAAGNSMKVCQTREMMDSKHFVNSVADCKISFTSRTGSSWKSHTSCPQSHLESDVDIAFLNPENYTTKTTSVVQSGGQTRTSHMSVTGKWLSADCGDIKPVATTP